MGGAKRGTEVCPSYCQKAKKDRESDVGSIKE